MKISSRRSLLSCLLALATLAIPPSPAIAQPTAPTPVVAEDPAFNAVAERRASGMMATLDLADAARAARVKQHIVNFMIALKNIHEGKNPPSGEARTQALTRVRSDLYSALEAERLSAEQQVVVKNGLSANHFKINYDAFLNLIPRLTDEEKAYLHAQLATGFDEAVILNDGTAKGAVFHKIRGRINNYLSQRGYDLKQLSQERNERNARK